MPDFFSARCEWSGGCDIRRGGSQATTTDVTSAAPFTGKIRNDSYFSLAPTVGLAEVEPRLDPVAQVELKARL